MQCFTQLTPPTAVTHAISLPFLSASANNLVIAKTSLLQLFSLKSIIADSAEPDPTLPSIQNGRPLLAKNQRRERMQTTKLVLITQYELSGTVIGLGRVKTLRSTSGGEAVLIALKDAKLSLIEWDPERYDISTISVHFYERDDIRSSPWATPLAQCVNFLTVDPSSRCAALKFGARHIAILPFHQAGDDLVMDDFEGESSHDQLQSSESKNKQVNGNGVHRSPYRASFVLSLLALDPNLMHVVHLAFLHEYREPTFGVLSSRLASSNALLRDRKDVLSYTVYTLDLEQRASTTLLSVTTLPYDLHTVLPLSLPVGGALLVGFNEVIHVDQAGKTNGVAVNEFSTQNTSFGLASQVELGMRLEGCVIEQLGISNGDMLIILKSGELAILHFRIDGRSVAGVSVRIIAEENGRHILPTAASCSTPVGRGRIFVGSEESDSTVIGWSSRTTKPKRQRSFAEARVHAELDALDPEEDGEEEEAEDEDDLYYNEKADNQTSPQAISSASDTEVDEYLFRIHDSLVNLAPLRDIVVLGAELSPSTDFQSAADATSPLQLIVSTGCGTASTLTTLSQGIVPEIKHRLDIGNVQAVWAAAMKHAVTPPSGSSIQSLGAHEYDNVIITSVTDDSGDEQSHVYALQAGIATELLESDFDSSAGATIALGTLNGGTRIVQVLKNEIRAYDDDLSLAQIFPISEEATSEDPKVDGASFAEPYLLLLRDDSNLTLLKSDDSGELEEIEQGAALSTGNWVSISLFDDSNDVFRLSLDDEEPENEESSVLIFLLSADGGLQIFKASNTSIPVYRANGLNFLPPFLSEDFTVRRSNARESLVEILVAELGDSVLKSPYLLLRSANDDVTIYYPYQATSETSRAALRFAKTSSQVTSTTVPFEDFDRRMHCNQRLRAVHNIGNFSAVLRSGVSPCLILRTASTSVMSIPFVSESVRAFHSFHSQDCQRGYIYVDDMGAISIAQLPMHVNLSTGWVSQTLFSGEDIVAFGYHAATDRYVIGIDEKVNYKLPDDELHPEWAHEETHLLPQIEQGAIKLFTPASRTITDTYALDAGEAVMCIKTMSLEISEITHARRPLIVVGTSLVRGEDLYSKGRIYVFDIIEVVPEPGLPETSRKLKLIAKEEVKGAVTSLSEIGNEGFLLAAQGQKCMVRGLKEDGTLLPVAFIDTQCYVSVAKELKASGLCIMADAVKGVWLTGYMEDPYQLRLFGKSADHIEVVAAEFLPSGKDLFVVVVDADGEVHVFQFDPHNPKSLIGQRLLLLSSFNTGLYPTTMTLLTRPPKSVEQSNGHVDTTDADETAAIRHRILIGSQNGSLSLLSSLTPSAYRTLAAMQAYLTNTLPHPLGLNPRAYRAAESDNAVGGRAVLDGDVLKRWMELGSWKRVEGVARAGVESEWNIRGLLSGLGL
ncbi:mRNA cleavage and polyadenylation factor subunit [Lambiella insularis]|nr:mRNA cleavage and polyadenylation factor subunit [Lambiella insularis]